MKKSILMIVAAAAVVFGAFSCSKPYDDSELRNKITTLESRISALESLQTQINELKTAVEKLQGGLKVTGVEKSGDAVTIKFSDGTSVTVTKTIIGVTEVNGVYCWTVNGETIKDPAGHVIPVGTQAPQLRAAADGSLEYSIDGGKTWNPLAGKMEAPTVEETDDAYIIHFGETSFSLPKDTPFYIRFAVASNFSIAYGETGEVRYEINGASLSDDVEVGILAYDEGFEVELVPADAQGGLLKIKNNNKTAESGRVIMYAANHKGKSDIKTLIFHSEPSGEVEFTAVIDAGVEEIVAEGGSFYLNVSADEDYTVGADVDWITVTPPTRALYEDKLAVKVEENPTTEPRTGNIVIRSKESDLMFSVEVKQAAGEAKPEVPDYMSLTGIYEVVGTGKYNTVSGSKLVVEEGTVTTYAVIWPAEEGEDTYDAGFLYEDGGEWHVSCYLDIIRDEETGAVGILACANDVWEHSKYGTITDWQYGTIDYEGDLYWITPGEEAYFIAYDLEPADGVITFEAGPQLNIQGFDDPFDIVSLEVVPVNSDDQVLGVYEAVPLPAVFTKLADLEEEEAASMSLSVRTKNALHNHAARKFHEFTPTRLQMFLK